MSSAHYPGAMAIRIDFWLAGEFIPHTNHTHWSSELQVTVLHYPGPIRKFDRHRPYPRTVLTTEVSKVFTKVAHRTLVVLLNHH